MPIVTNPKNIILDTSINIENISKKHQRDLSLVEPPHSKLSELNRNANAPANMSINGSNKTDNAAEIIASRINTNTSKSPDKYVIGNSLVVALNDSNVTAGSY
jgi:hypothetical protein